ncbi:SGNH/GDSL hydrolase family protein [Gimesia sp.]|uniref:SGNH/GDSL hydrolase family protein n=1 Tax=Gimesia sp. TaxID=2024833 RepID=UPI003A905E86
MPPPELHEISHTSPPIILLGASNLTRDFPLILRLLQSSLQSPLDIYTAMGHGRSYGNWSRVLYRALPGITRCELWDAFPLALNGKTTPLALLTDIGNDLIYGQSTETILSWVAQSIQQLREHQAQITITLLPEESLARLSSWRFELTRRLFFPNNPASLADLKEKVRELNQSLSAFADQDQISVVAASQEWYGFDPIHYRYSQRVHLWKTILSHWELPELSRMTARNHWLDSFYAITRLTPSTRRQWGKLQQKPQPVRILDEGTRISVF